MANTVVCGGSCIDPFTNPGFCGASGDRRWFTYERPRRVLRQSGVGPGTLLFEGRRNGNTYTGTSRVFSKYCPGEPFLYRVSGPVSRGQTRVTLYGEREIHDRCRPTGRLLYIV